MPKMPQKKPRKLTWKRHKQRWENCEKCDLCDRRKRIVLAKGVIPCNVLFVGEAPGLCEDAIGKPFIGPAGKLLDSIIDQAIGHMPSISCAFTNIICCIPKDEDGDKVSDPPEYAIKACDTRLREFVMLSKPDLIVAVGNAAAKALGEGICIDRESFTNIVHPAYILRSENRQEILIQESVVKIADAVDQYVIPF